MTITYENEMFLFGKHKGKTFADVWELDPKYLYWLNSPAFNPRTYKMAYVVRKINDFLSTKV